MELKSLYTQSDIRIHLSVIYAANINIRDHFFFNYFSHTSEDLC